MHPMETANYILILLGIALIISGPVITYKTIQGLKLARKEDPKASLHPFSNGLNFVIAFLFFVAGVLFVLNNLKGNPLTNA